MVKKPTLSIILLSDARPGHYRQSEGILAALALNYTLDVKWIELRGRSGISAGFARRLLRLFRLTGPRWLWSIFYKTALPPKPQLVLSTGAMTLPANALLAKIYGCQNLFNGSLRGAPAHWFSLCLDLPPTPSKNAEPVLKPNAIRRVQGGDHILILIGGNAGSHRYNKKDWQNLLLQIERIKSITACKVSLISSPRTPKKAEDILKTSPHIERLHLFSQQGPYSLQEYLEESALVLCSEDSNSMLSEALCSGLPVIALRPQWCKPNIQEQGYLDWLTQHCGLASMQLNNLEFDWQSCLDTIRPYKEDAVVNLNKLLRQKLNL